MRRLPTRALCCCCRCWCCRCLQSYRHPRHPTNSYDSRQRNERRKREEEQAVTELQSRAKPNRPNLAILDKLKLEMNKLDALRVAYEKTKAANTFTPADKNDLPYNKTALPTLDL